jgi:hypothetical protein
MVRRRLLFGDVSVDLTDGPLAIPPETAASRRLAKT